MPAASELTSVVDRQLLLQLGARLKQARVKQGLTTTQLAERAGMSRMTLGAIEAGEPTPTMGSYLRVMSVLHVSKDLALLASDSLHAIAEEAQAAYAAPRRLVVSVSHAKHELQDLQSLVLHEEAVRLVKRQPEVIEQASSLLERWRKDENAHSRFLWDEWAVILHRRAWRRVLTNTKRAKELRQASPLTAVLPAETRLRILDEVQALKRGIDLGSPSTSPPHPSRKESRSGT